MTRYIVLQEGWEFRRLGDPASAGWARVELPHSPFVADLDGRHHWLGECEYRHALDAAQLTDDTRCSFYVGAAMHSARVFVDDCQVGEHVGGFLPFEVDITGVLRAAPRQHVRLVLDNRDNPDVPPGKPFDELDFCWYGGLYRNAELRLRPPVHITDAVAAGEVAGGGVFIRTLEATAERATLLVRTHVRNLSDEAHTTFVRAKIQAGAAVVTTNVSPALRLAARTSAHVEQQITIDRPRRWSPEAPNLYDAAIELVASDERLLDLRHERFGVRRIEISRSGGFVLNSERLRLRGTNRHQEMPRVGYAVPRAAQFRDALRIKEAGFDYVRLSHYPQSPDFLDACDELGIVVMNCLPGWQFIGGPRFREAAYRMAREMIRRDRNHPCVVLWELSLNETKMDDEFMARLHAIGHEEYPGDQMFTAGWIDRYDVFIHSRQHGRIHTFRNEDKALVIAEYGDWEFYARNEGFDQKTGAGVFDRWSTSRQFRGDGERGLRQQVSNHIVALNDTLSSPAVLDGQWAMFDYARGYDPIRAAVGVMDLFRVPKFSYYLYQSQRGPNEHGAGWSGGPMVFIASHWLSTSARELWVFSNCEEVELRLNHTVVGRHRPAQTAWTQHLPHPPFHFEVARWASGTLEAFGYIDGKICAAHAVTTPGSARRLKLMVDDLALRPAAGESDVLIAHARIVDDRGVLCVTDTTPVTFSIRGAELLGATRVDAEAGIASTVIRLPSTAEEFVLSASTSAEGIADAELLWQRRNVPNSAVSAAEPALMPAS